VKRQWQPEELAAQWTLLPDERRLVDSKRGPSRLGFAVLLKFFQNEGRFPERPQEVPRAVLEHLAGQVGVPPERWGAYEWSGRTIKYHRAEVRSRLGFRKATAADGEALAAWLGAQVLAHTRQPDQIRAAAYRWFRDAHVEPPTPDRLDRLVKSALHTFEVRWCENVARRLSPATREQLEALLRPDPGAVPEAAPDAPPEAGRAVLHDLRADAGRASLESLLREVDRLQRLRALHLPADLFADVSPQVLHGYRQRVAVEEPYELRRHSPHLRTALLAVFCHLRGRELTDRLADLLIELVHRIGARAEQRAAAELLEDLKRVRGKAGLLFRLAEATLQHPEGVVKEVIFPVVGEQTLRDLVKEWQATGSGFRQQVQTVVLGSYRSHYRRMLPRLLDALEFHAHNEEHCPVLRALQLLRAYAESKAPTYPPEEAVPLDGVVSGPWRDAVVEDNRQGEPCVNRVVYEICVLQALRERLRCKEVWVAGADRYRNPDEDLPADFEGQRDAYYAALHLPRDARAFLHGVRQELHEELAALDRGLPGNPDVAVLPQAGGRIRLSPLTAQAEPANLSALKAAVVARWPMTSLLDVLKEADVRTGFTQVFRSPTLWENLGRDTLRHRLLLCLYGLGTNTGLKRVSLGHDGVSYKDLLYVRRRFITPDHLRHAITAVVNQTLRSRWPAVWGEGTTACASDAKQFGAWDQNLMTEWHARYGGRGVMIYWHVERKAACIYSQLKTCSSSEVAAMIEGVLRHCTEMAVARQYVDSHGQSEVAFAFCHLLGFQLLPRLKAIHRQKLYRAEAGQPEAFPRLQPVLSRPINWELIGQQYDPMVKYATALRLGTAEAGAILRRFTRNNVQHPTYQALAELGKALRTTFLCRYLRLPPLRREIQEGLKVVENWNGANGFILFGKGGEIATNRREDQEVTMLALHLLQSSLVYINTLMVQRVLGERSWEGRLTAEDLRALTPLFYSHITPYGTFHLDLDSRMDLECPPP
jgi:TnpA family transposase